ncbi:MAG: BamA/TamA family outer membrane protein [Sphingobium sp.]|nr:BamA/TamA family outer membrane protein [Sphingobium sp.]
MPPLYAVLVLLSSLPAVAQTQQPEAQAPPQSPPAVGDGEFSLDMDEQMDVGLAWPDMDAEIDEKELALPEPDEEGPIAGNGDDTQSADSGDVQIGEEGVQEPENLVEDDGSERRYRIVVNGTPQSDGSRFRERFNALSLLEEGSGKAANIAQINRRMRLDSDLIDRILRAEGYYDARIRPSIMPPEGGPDGKLRVVFNIRTGAQYTVSRVTLPGLAYAISHAPEVGTAFDVKAGDPLDADAITAARTELALALGENGFPFATVEEPLVTVDHETQKGDLEVPVRAGGYRRFGQITLDDETAKVFSARHLERIARFDQNDIYQASDVEDLRRAIVATGLVSSVTVKPEDRGDGEHADVAVSLTPAPVHTIAGEIGYGTGEGYRLEASWQHRNFFPPEGAITVRGLLGTKEQAAGVTYRRNNFRRRDNVLSVNLSARHQEYDAYKASTVGLSAELERQSNILYQKKWSWSVGAELLGSRERDFFGGARTQSNRDYLIAAVPLSVTYDASDDLLDPTKGFRIGGRLSPEVSWQGSAFTYARAQIDGSIYWPASDNVVIASRMRLGSIVGGVSTDRIAPSRRYYAGGGASVRGYGYQAIGPRDPNNDPVGGKSLMEFALEARVRLGNFGIVPFVDAGNIATGFLPELDDVRFGAGVGLRYYSSFGPIRIDVGTPLNRQSGDSRIAVYVSLGQAF